MKKLKEQYMIIGVKFACATSTVPLTLLKIYMKI